ncbi:MAG TPA: hypothetical protein VFF30_07055 [Nitrososphaerales archaeon]|nr:hypothetical protein [Nitrososphaerales archaeon]
MSEKAGVEPRPNAEETVHLLTDAGEILDQGIRLTESSKNEILFASISERTLLRNRETVEFLARKVERENAVFATGENRNPSQRNDKEKKEKKFRVRILIPVEDSRGHDLLKYAPEGMEYRTIESVPVSFGVYDRREAMLIQYSEEREKLEQSDSKKVIASAILTTNKQMVAGLVSLFDALWRQGEMRSELERLRGLERRLGWNTSKSLQEAVSYCQILMLGTEVLRSKVVTMQQQQQQGEEEIPSMLPILNQMQETVYSFAAFLERHRDNAGRSRDSSSISGKKGSL